jgi:8-oxo-dGTP diphosphatase
MTSLKETNLMYADGEHSVYGTWLSVDVVALTEDRDEARVVLIKRKGTPHRGKTTLPGGLLAAWDGEMIEQAARRVMVEKAGVEITGGVTAIDVVSDPHRDERGHTVSVVVVTRVPAGLPAGVPGAVFAEDVPDDMPFGHSRMLRSALNKIGERLLHDRGVTYALLGDTTTAADTFALLRACTPTNDPAARARLKRSSLYAATAETRGATGGRGALLYRQTAS